MKKSLSVIIAVIMLCLTAAVPVTASESSEEVSSAFMTEPVKLNIDVLPGVSYTLFRTEWVTDIIPCEQRNSVFFEGRKGVYESNGLYELNLTSGECNNIQEFGKIGYRYKKYSANNKIYVAENVDKGISIKIFNLLTLSYETPVSFSCKDLYAIGVDSKERFYVAASDETDNRYIYLLNKNGGILSKTPFETEVYEFVGFNESNGDFFTTAYYNWLYWGYEHDIEAVYKGNVSGGKIKYDNKSLLMLSALYYDDRYHQAEILGGKYLAADATLYSSYCLYDVNDLESDPKITAERLSSVFGEDPSDSLGTRSAYLEQYDSVVMCTKPNVITETDTKTGAEIGSIELEHNVFAMKTIGDRILLIEKDGNDFYYQIINWKRPSKVIISTPSKTVEVGHTLQLSAKTDLPIEQTYTWKSKDSKIASVNNNGTVYGWSSGSTGIVVTTGSGLTSTIYISVTGKRDDSTEALTVTEFGRGLAYNLNANDYYVISKPVESYLHELKNGEYEAVSYNDGKVSVISYNSDLSKYLGKKTINAELPLFGGYFSGEKYNYLVFGRTNYDESDDAEIMRVVKYNKSWKQLGDTKIFGSNTLRPFEAGSLRMTETDGKLYIHTCHTMYTSSDGLNHQANMTFVIDEATGTTVDSYYDVMNIDYGYVSHSFNQFIANDGKYVYRVDHGDAYPRGFSITKFSTDSKVTDVDYTIPMEFSGMIGANYTGASVGGMELTDNEVLIAGNSTGKTEETDNDDVRNIFVITTDKSLNNSKTVWLTNYTNDSGITVSTPQLVKIGPEQFLLMWTETDESYESVTKMVTLDSNGNKTSYIVKKPVQLSDCQPVFTTDGRVKWYVSNGEKAWFYSIDPFRLTETKVIKGDADGDGVVTVADVTLIQRYIAEFNITGKFDRKAADINGDGTVSIDDVTIIQRFLAEYIKKM